MPEVPITFACGLYDRMLALYTGEVQADGIDLNFLAIDNPRQIFDRMGRNLDFDACEMSSSEVFSRFAAGRREMVALPVFPSRVFRHGFITVDRKAVKTPEGPRRQAHRRPALHPDRGGLHPRHAAGRIRRRSLGRALGAGRHQQRAVARQPGGDRRCSSRCRSSRTRSGRSLSELLEGGEIQAIIGSGLPDALRTNPDVAAAVSEFPRGRARVVQAHARSSRSCISSPCAATSTRSIRSSPRASMRR